MSLVNLRKRRKTLQLEAGSKLAQATNQKNDLAIAARDMEIAWAIEDPQFALRYIQTHPSSKGAMLRACKENSAKDVLDYLGDYSIIPTVSAGPSNAGNHAKPRKQTDKEEEGQTPPEEPEFKREKFGVMTLKPTVQNGGLTNVPHQLTEDELRDFLRARVRANKGDDELLQDYTAMLESLRERQLQGGGVIKLSRPVTLALKDMIYGGLIQTGDAICLWQINMYIVTGWSLHY